MYSPWTLRFQTREVQTEQPAHDWADPGSCGVSNGRRHGLDVDEIHVRLARASHCGL